MRMETKDIKTSYDLADMLDHVVKVLRTVPEVKLTELQETKASDLAKKIQKDEARQQIQDRLSYLAKQLPSFQRERAETEITALTVPEIRQLATLFDIRMPSKMKKSESIDLFLSQMFDVPAGQELIRTFHKRNPVL